MAVILHRIKAPIGLCVALDRRFALYLKRQMLGRVAQIYPQAHARFHPRQIFDLSGYYRSATDAEVQSFSTLEILSITDATQFQSMADTWIRRKIPAINDSGVLTSNTAAKIKKLALNCGLEIEIENKKIRIPADKKKLKEILGFLDEEVYKGAFTEATYITNSKRKVQ